MAVLLGLVCGIVGGAAFAFLLAFIALAPYLGWMDNLVQPGFVIGALVCALYVGLKADRMGI